MVSISNVYGCLTALTSPTTGPSTEGLLASSIFATRLGFAGNRSFEIATGLLVDASPTFSGQATFLGLTSILDAAAFHSPLFLGGHLSVQGRRGTTDAVTSYSTISDLQVTDDVQDIVTGGGSSQQQPGQSQQH